nr:MAG TPA: hypothetical protein [Caudoviricetes sp.]
MKGQHTFKIYTLIYFYVIIVIGKYCLKIIKRGVNKMAEEEKIIKEEPETETTEQPEKIESAEDVVTEPEKEVTEEKSQSFVQLEQRVSSLEQRLNNLETQEQPSQDSSDPNFEDKTEPTEVDDDQETDGIESSEEIKEMLNL